MFKRTRKPLYSEVEQSEMYFSEISLRESAMLLSESEADASVTRFHSLKEDGSNKKGIIRHSDQWRVRWDLFVMLCAVYNCFIVPYEIAFTKEEPVELLVIAVLIDLMFVLDIVFNFRTTYIDSVTGDEVFDRVFITKHYIKTGLLIDIIATVPFDLIAGAAGQHDQSLKLTSLMKMVHVLRLGKIINNIRLSESYKIIIRLLHIVLSIVMFVHCIGCAWSIVVGENEEWMPPSEGPTSDYYHAKTLKRYSFSLYHAVYMWAGVEINPQSSLEMFFLITVILVGSILRAVLFGKMAVLMSNLSKESQRIASILDSANTAMKNMQLPESLQLKISDYLLATQHTLAQQEEFEQLMTIIPPSYRIEVSAAIYTEAVLVCPVLKAIPALFKPLIKKLQVRFVYPETTLIEQGDMGDKLHYLVKGLCEVEVFDEHKKPHKVTNLHPGHYYGELALLYNTTRTATVRSVGYATVGELTKADFLDLVANFPEATEILNEQTMKYSDPWKLFITTALKNVPYFKSLPDDVITLLMYNLHSKSIDTEQMLFTEGSIAEHVYLVAEGSLNIYYDFKTKTLQGLIKEHYCDKQRRDSYANDMDEEFLAVQDLGFNHAKTSLPKSSQPFSSASLKLEVARIGNVLCASQAIIRAEVKVNCVAAEPSVVFYISTKEIEELMRNLLPLKHQVEAARARLLKFDQICGEVIKIVPLIDFSRSYLNTPFEQKRALQNTLKFKNVVLSLLIRKRRAQASGLGNIKSMIVRLRAMMKAETAGFVSLARQIALGEVNPEAADVLGVLNEHELRHPLLTQFAAKVQSVKDMSDFLEEKMAGLTNAVGPQRTSFEDIGYLMKTVMLVVKQLEQTL